MDDFLLPFELEVCNSLDQFALLARQDYNLGNKGEWFGCFRGGLYGMYARNHGVTTHFQNVHSWLPTPRTPTATEYNITSIFFNMDSAIECFVFAINSLGYAVANDEFLDVADENSLRRVAPRNILGTDRQAPIAGYGHYFPNLQQYWQSNRDLMDTISEQHDVSKHRQTIYQGGKFRNDPPPGFFERLGITGEETHSKYLLSPMADIILSHDPRTPPSKRQSSAQLPSKILQDVGEEFCNFINESCSKAFKDAKEFVILPNAEFLER